MRVWVRDEAPIGGGVGAWSSDAAGAMGHFASTPLNTRVQFHPRALCHSGGGIRVNGKNNNRSPSQTVSVTDACSRSSFARFTHMQNDSDGTAVGRLSFSNL